MHCSDQLNVVRSGLPEELGRWAVFAWRTLGDCTSGRLCIAESVKGAKGGLKGCRVLLGMDKADGELAMRHTKDVGCRQRGSPVAGNMAVARPCRCTT